jgi:hypothetical protein
MLPDFQKSRQLMQKLWNRAAFKGVREGGPIAAQIKKRQQQEGREAQYHEISGKQKQMEYKKVAAELRIQPEDAKGMSLEEFLKAPTDAGREIGSQMDRNLIEELSTVTAETGNVIDAKGEPYQFKHFLQTLEMIQFDFDSSGRPILPTAYLGANAYEQAQKSHAEWGKSPEERKRLEEILSVKKEQFREREINRRLAD